MSHDDRPKSMQELWASSPLAGGNAAYLEEIYEAYLRDPNAVPSHWRDYFDGLPRVNGTLTDVPHSDIRREFRNLARQRAVSAPIHAAEAVSLDHERKQVRVLQLINAYRFRGHQLAKLDPLALARIPEIPELTLAHHGLSEADLGLRFNTGSLTGPSEATLAEILDTLQRTYCHHIGVEYMHITNTEEKRWIQQRLETSRAEPGYEEAIRRRILYKLSAAEGIETYLHAKYVGQKRFSLEGGESLIPLLDRVVQRAGEHGVKEVVLGMAHRGRLNVLVNVLGKTPRELFQEFEGKHNHGDRTGDVKYHMGFSSDVQTAGGPVHLALAFNPSHLEIVNPVVEGSVRARQDRRGDRHGREVLPVLIHGDAAFAGQGVVMETLNMSQTRGFATKGTVHIVINNQIGFTTSTQKDARSTYYCTDVVKMVNAPIFHVNGDDPEAVAFVTQLALDFRMAFRKDVVVDVVCYRRHGHNEADEPAVTQPMMYQRIRALQTTRALYAERLAEAGVIGAEEGAELQKAVRARLEAGECMVDELVPVENVEHAFGVDWSRYHDRDWMTPAKTSVPQKRIRALAEKMSTLPEGFEVHPRVGKILDDRRKMASGALPVDWGFAETMAYATLVTEGYRVRLSGQDAGRGTFFHRHAVLHNQQRYGTYVPLRNLADDQGNFLVIDSLLSEEAVLGFEYGYATAAPETLVIWEAQFGDFANGAQVVIDQFISSGEQKWGRLCGLTLLLPHGYEGQGPEHSSARLERYLQLCAQHNMQVCVPTTPAQVFHMLRRQMLRRYRKPLVVMSPKSLLRHKLAVNALEDLTEGSFQPVIDEIDAIDPKQVKRVVMCSGKVYFDLLERRREQELDHVAILRLEQLYPFPEDILRGVLEKYSGAECYVWCQEEPLNQGAWYSTQHHIRATLGHDHYLYHITRPDSASPAAGYYGLHVQQQRALVDQALGLLPDPQCD